VGRSELSGLSGYRYPVMTITAGYRLLLHTALRNGVPLTSSTYSMRCFKARASITDKLVVGTNFGYSRQRYRRLQLSPPIDSYPEFRGSFHLPHSFLPIRTIRCLPTYSSCHPLNIPQFLLPTYNWLTMHWVTMLTEWE
jgi:hypothetical protein